MLLRMLLVPYVWQLLKVSWLLTWDRRVFPLLKLLPLGAVIYVLSPIDMLRDFKPWIGQVDDVIVTVALLTLFVVLSPREIVREHIRGRGDDDDKPTIDGEFRYTDKDE